MLPAQQKEDRICWVQEVSVEDLEKADYAMRVVAMNNTTEMSLVVDKLVKLSRAFKNFKVPSITLYILKKLQELQEQLILFKKLQEDHVIHLYKNFKNRENLQNPSKLPITFNKIQELPKPSKKPQKTFKICQ